ncbi:Zinc import ATP-binding protein ZnuC [Buchnera aphidicola (Tetraneura ulmi)]|uniref:zinc ABC transporter ATP-binding protein ZnuC n=1 Tax=Buchnera aphidicola TaxID=9 RepID=UPI0034638910
MKTLVNIKNVSVEIRNKSILSNISFLIKSNKIVTVIGSNGAGKSTLVRTILGLVKPSVGTIKFLKPVRIGYVPQKLYFRVPFPITVNRFMKLFKSLNYSYSNFIIEKLKISHLKNHLIQELSGGELQKVLLARSLLNNPNFLILDEPTQGLDINGQIFLYHIINKIKKKLKCSILMISHDLNLVMARTDEVICLNNHICCSGTPDVVSKNKHFISMFGKIHSKEIALYKHEHHHIHS